MAVDFWDKILNEVSTGAKELVQNPEKALQDILNGLNTIANKSNLQSDLAQLKDLNCQKSGPKEVAYALVHLYTTMEKYHLVDHKSEDIINTRMMKRDLEKNKFDPNDYKYNWQRECKILHETGVRNCEKSHANNKAICSTFEALKFYPNQSELHSEIEPITQQ